MRDGAARPGSRGQRVGIPFALLLLALAMLMSMAKGPARAEVATEVQALAQNGYGRIVLTLAKPVEHEVTLANGVVVIRFDEPVTADLLNLASELPRYLGAARLDLDGRAIRLAANQPLNVNSMAAASQIFVDLLPASWAGPPPGLPPDVVARLIREAEEAASRAMAATQSDDSGPPLVVLRSGRYPTFSRIVFDWSEPTTTGLSRKDDTVTVSFDRKAALDVASLNVDPPPGLERVTTRDENDLLQVVLEVEPGADVRGFQEGSTYVVDVTAPDVAPPENPLADALPGFLPDRAGGSDRSGAVVLTGEETGQTVRAAAEPASTSTETTSGTDPGTARSADGDLVSLSVSTLDLASPSNEAGTDAPADETRPVASDQGGADAAGPETHDRAPGTDNAMTAEVLPSSFEASTRFDRHSVETRMIGSTLQLTFPFAEPVASAVFQRAETLWIVFDDDDPLDFETLKSIPPHIVGAVDTARSVDTVILRLTLAGRYLITATARENNWIITLGDLILEPTTPVVLERALRTDGRAKVVADLPDSGRVHWLRDPTVGDRLAIVTAYGPPRGLIKNQAFVDFAGLPSAHGLAVKPLADDLAVRINQNELVITRERGLTVSDGRWPKYVPGQRAAADGTRPGFIDFGKWTQGNVGSMRHHLQRLLTSIASLPVEERVHARLELARLYLAHELGAEALGIMRIALAEDAKVENDPVFRAMRGVGELMMGRLDDARRDFSVFGLERDPHTALWRGVVEMQAGDWRAAQLSLQDGQSALDAYPPRQRARFQIAMARAALNTNDLQIASRNLEAMEGIGLSAHQTAEAALLNGWLAEALGETREAMEIYAAIEQGPIRPVATEAAFRKVDLFLRERRMKTDAAIAKLESLAIAWRGDGIELDVLRRLSRLYVDTGRFRDALMTMKDAIVSHDDGTKTRLINDDMARLFADLFLEGKADGLSPIKALGLYYDFRELTPVGRRGDEMIRKLARRLVDVDLLDQAAELLDHQVHNRLAGSARAQVAADLALIYLKARRPESSLRAIRQTRVAQLPVALRRKRDVLEARALSELGRVDTAIELLSTQTGPDVERLKADALWNGQRWQMAGEQFERLLGNRWQDAAPLDDPERGEVMRAAISFALADDRLGTDRLRRKFASKMAASPDSHAFDLVTKPNARNGVAFHNLAREIAEIDTLDAFLKSFRESYDDFGISGAGEGADGAPTPAVPAAEVEPEGETEAAAAEAASEEAG